jgi:hypothetical protein
MTILPRQTSRNGQSLQVHNHLYALEEIVPWQIAMDNGLQRTTSTYHGGKGINRRSG